jgi:NADH-quinone oxidoreductase subunit H
MVDLALWAVAKSLLLILVFCLGGGALLTWVERRMSAIIQDRVGPVRAAIGGRRFFGLLHPIADGIKMLFKEDFAPAGADRWLFFWAPLIAFVPPLVAFLALPFGPSVDGREWFVVGDTPMGILFVLATASMAIYGHTLAGWSSNNRFSLLGSLRTASQVFAYEVGLTLSLLGILMVYGTVIPQEMVASQSQLWFGLVPRWGIFCQPLGFVLFMAAAIAETKRSPFDLPEADSELVAGYSTEYSAMRFAMFFLSEFVGILLVAALGATLFLGGWHLPGLSGTQGWVVALQVLAYLAKIAVLVYLQMLVRWTLPRMRFDQVLALGWKVLIPAGLFNVLATAAFLWFIA